MSTQILELFKTISLGVLAGLACGPLAVWLARKTKLMDIPGHSPHKLHDKPTPLAGGMILMLGLVILISVLGLWERPISTVMLAAGVVFVFGLWDDARGLSAPKKFVGQLLATSVLVILDVQVRFLHNISLPLGPNSGLFVILDWGVTFFWFVGITNAFNLIDSMDRLAVGVAGIAFGFFAVMASISGQSSLAIFSAICLGLCIGIMYYNRSPSRLFLGDSGALVLGFILAAVAMIYRPLEVVPQGSSWFVPIIIVGYPIFDTTCVVVSRLRRKKSIFRADRNHVYHRLCGLGIKPGWAVTIIHVTCILLGLIANYALVQTPLLANVILGVVLAVSLGLIIYFEWQLPMDVNSEQGTQAQSGT